MPDIATPDFERFVEGDRRRGLAYLILCLGTLAVGLAVAALGIAWLREAYALVPFLNGGILLCIAAAIGALALFPLQESIRLRERIDAAKRIEAEWRSLDYFVDAAGLEWERLNRLYYRLYVAPPPVGPR